MVAVVVDLRRAFDRVEHKPLFEALAEQGVPQSYINLLQRLYQKQVGLVGENENFDILRGVRQGDVLSPLLFNAVLEKVLRRWKGRLANHGVDTSPHGNQQRLTNVRYADDLILFAKNMGEAVEMMKVLCEELAGVGLEVNSKKTKILTTDSRCNGVGPTMLIDSDAGFLEVMREGDRHKYLGKMLTGSLVDRGSNNASHRISVGWSKFHAMSATLCNKKLPVKLRFRLFDSVVTPAGVYSMATTPLTCTQMQGVDVIQRKMLRKIVGWHRHADETWDQTGHRMKTRLAAALEQYHVKDWSGVI